MEAKALGYTSIFLDTLTHMKKVISLYKGIGFKRVEKYYDSPIDDMYYLKREL